MSKTPGHRTGREAKRRRRRHERRTSDAMHRLHLIVDGEPIRDWGRLRAAIQIGIGGAARAGKTARAAEFAELWQSGRILTLPPPPYLYEERPLTDADLALRYAFESMGVPPARLGLNAGGDSDLRAYYRGTGRDALVVIDDQAPPETSDPAYREAVREWSATYLPAIKTTDDPDGGG